MEIMRNMVEVSMNEYKYLLALQERICILEREMNARVREKKNWMGLDDLKIIFDLWEDVPEIVRDTDPPCDSEPTNPYQE